MLRIRVKMPDGSAWDVPAEYVAEQRAVVLEGLFDLALAVRQWRRTGNQAPLMDLAHAIEKHAPPVSGETNVEHAQRCLRCLMDGRQAPVTLRAALATPPTPTGDQAAADDAGARREVYVLMLESAMTSGTAATIEAVYAVREHAEKHAALINERSAVQRARVCVEPLVMEDRYPMFAAPQEPA